MNGAYERRNSERILHAIRTDLILKKRGTQRAITLDISEGGAQIDSPKSCSPGEIVLLHFRTQATAIPPIKATVRRCDSAFGGKRYVLALQFVNKPVGLMSLVRGQLDLMENRTA
jgi:PilZ domain